VICTKYLPPSPQQQQQPPERKRNINILNPQLNPLSQLASPKPKPTTIRLLCLLGLARPEIPTTNNNSNNKNGDNIRSGKRGVSF
jgi:hypothetical protein